MRIPTAFVLAALTLAAGCASNALAPVGGVYKAAPEFSLPTEAGSQFALSSVKGKVILLDFWATWCTGCLQALPHLQSISENTAMAQRGLVVLAINEQEKPEEFRPMISGEHFTFPVARDADGSTASAYSAFVLPTTVIVGRDGLVHAVITGWTTGTAEQIDAALNAALDAPIPQK